MEKKNFTADQLTVFVTTAQAPAMPQSAAGVQAAIEQVNEALFSVNCDFLVLWTLVLLDAPQLTLSCCASLNPAIMSFSQVSHNLKDRKSVV